VAAAQQGFHSIGAFSFPSSASPASRLGEHEMLGEDVTRTPDPN